MVGALLLFFSWLVTSTLGERLRSLEANAADSQAERSMLSSFKELNDAVDSVAAEVIHVHSALIELAVETQGALTPSRIPSIERDRARRLEPIILAGARLNARQIDSGIDACNLALTRQTRGPDSPAVAELKHARAEMTRLKQAKDEILDRAHQALREGDGVQTLDLLSDILAERSGVIERFDPILRAAVQAMNDLELETRDEIARVTRQANVARKASIVLYAVGTMMVVAGTAVSNFVD